MSFPTFAEACAAAHIEAMRVSVPFVPSIAQSEQALAPLVDRLVRMDHPSAVDYIKRTYDAHAPLHSTAVFLYRQQRMERMTLNITEAQQANMVLKALHAVDATGHIRFNCGKTVIWSTDGSLVVTDARDPQNARIEYHSSKQDFRNHYGL